MREYFEEERLRKEREERPDVWDTLSDEQKEAAYEKAMSALGKLGEAVAEKAQRISIKLAVGITIVVVAAFTFAVAYLMRHPNVPALDPANLGNASVGGGPNILGPGSYQPNMQEMADPGTLLEP